MITGLKRTLKRALQSRGYVLYRRPWLPKGVDPWETVHALLGGWDPSIAFDVGANVGDTCAEIAHHFPSARIHAFEPISDTFGQLSSRVATIANIAPHQLAIGSKPGNSVVRLCKESTLNSLRDDLQPSTQTSSETIAVTTIDLFCEKYGISRINLLKSDTEGNELEVLAGAQRMLTQAAIDVILVEAGLRASLDRFIPLETVVEKLASYDIMLVGVYNQRGWTHLHAAEFCDALFVRRSLFR